MDGVTFIVLIGLFANAPDTVKTKQIDEALESIETVLRFRDNDNTPDLTVISKVQKILDQIKNASNYTEDLFTSNQKRTNTESEVKPMAIHWEDQVFSYEITRTKKKDINNVNKVKNVFLSIDEKQLTDNAQIVPASNKKDFLRTNTNSDKMQVTTETNPVNKKTSLRSFQTTEAKREADHKVQDKTTKLLDEVQYELGSHELLPNLTYDLDLSSDLGENIGIGSSKEYEYNSELQESRTRNKGQVVRHMYKSNEDIPDDSKSTDEWQSDNSGAVKEVKIKVQVMRKKGEKKEVLMEDATDEHIEHSGETDIGPPQDSPQPDTPVMNPFNYEGHINLPNSFDTSTIVPHRLDKNSKELPINRKTVDFPSLDSSTTETVYKKITTSESSIIITSANLKENKIKNALQNALSLVNAQKSGETYKNDIKQHNYEKMVLKQAKVLHNFIASNKNFNQNRKNRSQESKVTYIENNNIPDTESLLKIRKRMGEPQSDEDNSRELKSAEIIDSFANILNVRHAEDDKTNENSLQNGKVASKLDRSNDYNNSRIKADNNTETNEFESTAVNKSKEVRTSNKTNN